MTRVLKKILLVDDDRVTNLMHRRVIERNGLASVVDEARDGQEALDYLQAISNTGGEAPQLILLDINMPRMNGFDFLKEYASLPPAITERQMIVMLSTSMREDDRDRATADPNVHSFVTKPVRMSDVSDFIIQFHQLVDEFVDGERA